MTCTRSFEFFNYSKYLQKYWIVLLMLFGLVFLQPPLRASELTTNEAVFRNPPSWLKVSRIDQVVGHIQQVLEWDIRRVTVIWYNDQQVFQNFHHFGSTVLAVTDKEKNTVHIGPRVNSDNFNAIFGHELVHVILFQKYKKVVHAWLEEGLANYIAKKGHVDFAFIASHSLNDVRALVHPFLDGKGISDPTFHYQVSTALIEMIAKKCNLENLLQLSVGSQLESYLMNTCEITDINQAFKKWVKSKLIRLN